MSDLHAKIRISAAVDGAEKVDGLAGSVDHLGTASKRVGADSGVAAAGLAGIGEAAQAAEQKATPAHRKIGDGVRSISEQLAFLTQAYAAWQGAQASVHIAADVGRTADAYNGLAARMKLVTGEGEAFRSAFAGIEQVALRTGSSLEATGNLFARLAQAGKALGLSQQQALALAETVNQAVQLSGASAQASDAAITQLIQGLQGGVLRGDEFNSVMEQSPRLAQALADGLGKTTGELRRMAEAGALSAEVVMGALRGQAATLEKEFATLPASIGRALENLSTQWTLYIGRQDEATGSSAVAAKAINALAGNLDNIGSALINLGQAYLGFKAFSIAAEFMAISVATNTAAASAVRATTNWAQFGIAAQLAGRQATAAAGETAVAANAAAAAGGRMATAMGGAATGAEVAAAGVGRFAGALSLLKGFSLAFLVTNLVDIGKWLGEAAAKAMGYGRALEEMERKARAAEKASRAMAQADDELAQKMRLAETAALGLDAVSLKMIGDFDELRGKGESVEKALAEVVKSMDLSNVQGIAAAGAALDALALKGKLTAEQVRAAWAKALDGKDLQVFEVQAGAAFDGSVQGVRRLTAALDGQLSEALRRTGLDAGALAGGINTAAVSALNDLDTLVARLGDLGQQGVQTGVALQAALDNALKASTTEAAVAAVIERWQQLGRAGKVSGEQLAEGLRTANAKLDEMKPGVNSLAEAWKTLGMKSKEELQKTASTAKEAYEAIKTSGTASTLELREAFAKYAEAAIAANGGVASGAVQSEAAMRGMVVEVDSAGKAMVKLKESAKEAERGVGDTAKAADEMAKSTTTVSRAVNAFSMDNQALAEQLGLSGAEAEAFASKFSELIPDAMQRARSGTQDAVSAFSTGWSQAEMAAKEYAKSVGYVNDLTERLGKAAQEGSADLAGLVAEAEKAAGGVQGLGDQELSGLRSALASAKQQMESLKDSAESTLSSLQEELAQMNGNYEEAERLRYEARRADLEAQLALASAQGNNAATIALSKAIATLDQIAQKKMAEARQREAEEAARTSASTSQAGAAAASASHAASAVGSAMSGMVGIVNSATQAATAAANVANQSAAAIAASTGISSGGAGRGGGSSLNGMTGGEGARGESRGGEAYRPESTGREPAATERRSNDTGSRAAPVINISFSGAHDFSERAGLESFARKLAPVLNDLTRRSK